MYVEHSGTLRILGGCVRISDSLLGGVFIGIVELYHTGHCRFSYQMGYLLNQMGALNPNVCIRPVSL